jgi:hypothetical protein
MTTNLPVAALTFLGTLITVLGFAAAGSLQVVIVGLLAIAFAGVLQVAAVRRA